MRRVKVTTKNKLRHCSKFLVRIFKHPCLKCLLMIIICIVTILWLVNIFFSITPSLTTKSDVFDEFRIPSRLEEFRLEGQAPLCRAPRIENDSVPLWATLSLKTQVRCKSAYKDLFVLQNNKLYANQSFHLFEQLEGCTIQAVEWKNDVKVVYSRAKYLSREQLKKNVFTANHDFFSVECKFAQDTEAVKFHFVQTLPKTEIHDRIALQHTNFYSKIEKNRRPNVLIIQLGGINFREPWRQLPRVMRKLKQLNALRLPGYNVIGQNIGDNVIPLLTGMSMDEVMKSTDQQQPMKQDNEGSPQRILDHLKLLWYEYERLGYTTLFAEDSANDAVFNVNGTGFSEKPTDNYMRPFWINLRQFGACPGQRKRHDYLMEYVKDFFIDYRNVSKFGLLIHHDAVEFNEDTSELDRSLEKLLSVLIANENDNNLAVLLLGLPDKESVHDVDKHNGGLNYNYIQRQSLAFATLLLPKWFCLKKEKLYLRLLYNSGRLITPYDLYAFLYELPQAAELHEFVLENEPAQSSKGISLMKTFPLDKNCLSSGVPVQWCVCLRIDTDVSSNLNLQLPVTKALLHHMRKLCKSSTLNLDLLYLTVFLPKNIDNVRRLGGPKSIEEESRFTYFYLHAIYKISPNGFQFLAALKLDREKNDLSVLPDIRPLTMCSKKKSFLCSC